jgi:hypothetical protein
MNMLHVSVVEWTLLSVVVDDSKDCLGHGGMHQVSGPERHASSSGTTRHAASATLVVDVTASAGAASGAIAQSPGCPSGHPHVQVQSQRQAVSVLPHLVQTTVGAVGAWLSA